MGARLSRLAFQPALAGRTRRSRQTCLTRTIRPNWIDLDVMVCRVDAKEKRARAVVSLERNAFRRSTLQIMALLLRASLSRSTLRSEALVISKAPHISAATTQQTCA